MARGGRRNQHSWTSAYPHPEINLICIKCGMQQKPEKKPTGGYREFYRLPGEPWQESVLVPWCARGVGGTRLRIAED